MKEKIFHADQPDGWQVSQMNTEKVHSATAGSFFL